MDVIVVPTIGGKLLLKRGEYLKQRVQIDWLYFLLTIIEFLVHVEPQVVQEKPVNLTAPFLDSFYLLRGLGL